MPSAHDVASYLLKKHGKMTVMKLQKLVYYCQAWSLVWDEEPLFSDRIEAWANGPVIPTLYDIHKGQFEVSEWKGDSAALTKEQQGTVNAVLEFYGPQTAQWLSDLTHREAPWIMARQGLADGDRGNKEITQASLHEYYSSI